jgi:hypothetical protein
MPIIIRIIIIITILMTNRYLRLTVFKKILKFRSNNAQERMYVLQ